MADLPINQTYAGPSVLSDGYYAYTAINISRDVDGDTIEDIKFTMLDLQTYEEAVLYRSDFGFSGTYNGWGYPVKMVLYGQGVLYALEIYNDTTPFYNKNFNLIKIDFISESITVAYTDAIYSGTYSVLGWNTFMVVFKNEADQSPYLTWDMVISIDKDIKYKSYTATTEETIRYELHDPCIPGQETKIYGYNWIITDNEPAFPTFSEVINHIQIYTFDLEAEETIYNEMLYEIPYYSNNFDQITTVYNAPSPIYYDGYLYLVYGIYNEARLRNVSATYMGQSAGRPPGPYGNLCFSITNCFFGPEADEYHWEMWEYRTDFLGHLYWLIIKVDPTTGDKEEKEFFNNRRIFFTQHNYDSLPTYVGCTDDFPIANDVYYAYDSTTEKSCAEYHQPVPLKTVFDKEEEVLYVKVKNPNQLTVVPTIETPANKWTPDADDIAATTYGLFKINILDFDDYNLIMYPEKLDIFDIFMSKENAYRLQLIGNDGFIYRLWDNEYIGTIGEHYVTDYQDTNETWNENDYGMLLTQQASTDEDRIWKLIPVPQISESDPAEFQLIGYSLSGLAPRELTLPAPFLFENLFWFDLNQHDGKIILSTGEDVGDGFIYPRLGIWLIQ